MHLRDNHNIEMAATIQETSDEPGILPTITEEDETSFIGVLTPSTTISPSILANFDVHNEHESDDEDRLLTEEELQKLAISAKNNTLEIDPVDIVAEHFSSQHLKENLFDCDARSAVFTDSEADSEEGVAGVGKLNLRVGDLVSYKCSGDRPSERTIYVVLASHYQP
ncbi:hypothetical protein LTR66_016469, partial [Elasticomyces elasticus]